MASDHFPPSPGFFGILFGVTLSILAGVLLAAAHLIATPVAVLTTEPKEPEPGVIYFVSGVKGGDWERKVASLSNSGASVRFSEGELNGWAERLLEQYLLKTKSNGTPEDEAAAKDVAHSLNLRLVGDELQIGFVMDRALGEEGSKLVMQVRGRFEKGLFGWSYSPTLGYIGALPVHKIPGMQTLARTYFQKWAPVLSNASLVEVRDGALAVNMP